MVTGGYGFIGSHLTRYLLESGIERVVNVDCLTYAGNTSNLLDQTGNPAYHAHRVDVADTVQMTSLMRQYQPTIVLHLAAESHVDRSIDGASRFVHSNVAGTLGMLQAFQSIHDAADPPRRASMRFVHVSTDEVFGVAEPGTSFSPNSPYAPRSPYAASKAAADHLVDAWHHTHGLPTIITHATNNYGPHQHPEKFIPTVILTALAGNNIPVYGDGCQIRDWMHVTDHVAALVHVAAGGQIGQRYLIGAENPLRNLDVVHSICQILDSTAPSSDGTSYASRVRHVVDRPGHDRRYAVDADATRIQLNWSPQVSWRRGIEDTVQWYLENPNWWWSVLAASDGLRRRGLTKNTTSDIESSVEPDKGITGE